MIIALYQLPSSREEKNALFREKILKLIPKETKNNKILKMLKKIEKSIKGD